MGSLYGFEVKTELPLRRLNAAAGRRGTLTVAAAAEPLRPPPVKPVSFLSDETGKRWYASYDLGEDRCLIELPPSGRFLVDPGMGCVTVDADDEDVELLEHRIACTALCTLLALREDLVLHASAVEVDSEAVVFCGPSQRGKSTLAAALGAARHPILGEDGVAIELAGERPVAYPGARGVRMRGHDEAGQRRTELEPDPGPAEPGPCPVAGVVLLEERGPVLTVEPLPAARALALLTPNLLHSGTRASIGTAFGRLARLLSEVPAVALSLADDLDELAAFAASFSTQRLFEARLTANVRPTEEER